MRQLVAEFQQGDIDASNELFRRVQSRMQGMANSMVRRFPRLRRWVEEEDVIQEALLRMLRALQAVQPSNMRAFYGLAAEQIRRELIDLTRKYFGPEGAGAHHESNYFLNHEGTQPSPGMEAVFQADPSEELERWTALHQAVEYLDVGAREVFSLTFYHGWGQREIAELMGVDERTVRRRWKRAVILLTDRLGGKLPTDIQDKI
jgi:RNA polymerase sigma-70 factor (ECF subfamily)